MIKAKERTDKYGIQYLTYKEGRKTISEIQMPYSSNVYRAIVGGLCWDYSSLERAKERTEMFLNNLYFEPIKIVYL